MKMFKGRVHANELVVRRVEQIVYKRSLTKIDYEAIIRVMLDATQIGILINARWVSMVQEIDRWLRKRYKQYQGEVMQPFQGVITNNLTAQVQKRTHTETEKRLPLYHK